MLIKNILNEFESDWAAVPTVEKEIINKLKNKTVLVCGNELARCFCYALMYLNDSKALGIKIVVTDESKDRLYCYNQKVFERDDILFKDFYSLSELNDIDYAVYTGLCGEQLELKSEAFIFEINAVKAVAQTCARLGAKAVVMSDSRVYGKPDPHRVYSENEYADICENMAESFDSEIFATVENLWSCYAKSFELTILRSGIILGACTRLKSGLENVFDSVAKGVPCSLEKSGRKLSFVYISDVFKAIIYSLFVIDKGVYNVSGVNSLASTDMISAILTDVYEDKADITLVKSENPDFGGCAINSNKIIEYGCSPSMSLETALELCVMSKMSDNKAMTLPHNHDGRLSSIQNILLAYLLEVDRICKKHNIKYFLGGGTLLGAIRHKGFIPWDDDADIMMLREDYDKFCKIAKDEMPPSMTFQTNKTDKSCFYEFAKFRLNDTVFATGFAKNHKQMHNGLAFDIFCHDKTANSRLGQKLHLGMTLFTRALVFNKWNNRKAENGSKIQSLFTNACKALFPIRFSLWLERRTLSFFKRKKNAKYLYDGMGRNIYNGCFPIELLDKVIYVDFEGYKLPVPERYDEYLTFLYGDYMELAPLSTRLGCHEIKLCDIGKYDGFKLKEN